MLGCSGCDAPGSDQFGREDRCVRSWTVGLCSQAPGWDLAEGMVRVLESMEHCKDGMYLGSGPGAVG